MAVRKALRIIIAIAFLFLGILVFKVKIIDVAILLLLIGIGSASTLYRIPLRSPLNFELISLVTIFAGARYGIPAAVFVGLMSTVLSRIITGHIDERLVIYSLGIVPMAFATAIVHLENFFLAGMACVVIFHLVTFPIIQLLGGRSIQGMFFVASNIIFNAFIFFSFSNFVHFLL